MRQFSRFTVKQLSKSRKEAREKLESKIENFEKNENPSQDEFSDYEEAKTELEKIYDNVMDSIILWSKAQWYEEGEKASKYFLTLEKNRKAKTCIQRLNSESNGQIDIQSIMLEIKTLFCNLCEDRTSVKTEEECLQYLSKLSTPKLSEDEKVFAKKN